MDFFYVFIGGGLGSICRYGIAKFFNSSSFDFPLATLVANFFACIILGFLSAYVYKHGQNDYMKFIFMIGFCGGFSTFSTFTNDTFKLLNQGHVAMAFSNIFSSILLCMMGLYFGYKLLFVLK